MATSGNEGTQLCTPIAKAAYTGLYVYSNEFVKDCQFCIIEPSEHNLFKERKRQQNNNDVVQLVSVILTLNIFHIDIP